MTCRICNLFVLFRVRRYNGRNLSALFIAIAYNRRFMVKNEKTNDLVFSVLYFCSFFFG